MNCHISSTKIKSKEIDSDDSWDTDSQTDLIQNKPDTKSLNASFGDYMYTDSSSEEDFHPAALSAANTSNIQNGQVNSKNQQKIRDKKIFNFQNFSPKIWSKNNFYPFGWNKLFYLIATCDDRFFEEVNFNSSHINEQIRQTDYSNNNIYELTCKTVIDQDFSSKVLTFA